MKFTLKLQIDSASELANFIQDLNWEIDMPFLDQLGSDKNLLQIIAENSETIDNLRNKIANYEKLIERISTVSTEELTPVADDEKPEEKTTVPEPKTQGDE